MSLFYYILYRASAPSDMEFAKGKLLFVLIQYIWIVFTPIIIISKLAENEIIKIHFLSTERIIFGIIGLIAILIFDYFNYFRKIKEKEILKKYTYKYKLIENKPILMFIASYFGSLLLWLFLIFFI